MLSVTDLKGNIEPFTHFQGLKRTRKVNGEKTIELTVLPTEKNAHAFNLIEEESIISALDDDYVIKKLNKQSRGKTHIKNVTAIHKFFVDLINKQQPKVHNGSITFNNYMNLVFEDTPYTFVAIDFFPARSFENLGNDNRLALLQKGLDRFQAEFELVGNQVRFYKQIGNETDFQFRYGHNIKAIKVDIDTTNLATRIRGTGDPELGIEAEYISPNSAIYGIIDAPPVNDERFKSEASLLEEMKRRLQDEPEVSITIDFVDLRAAGYPYAVPNEGDRVWLIYEPMDDLLIETRIMEIVEYFDANLNVIKTEVTLSNHKKSFAGTMFDNVRKQLREIVNDDGIIRYSALDEAVKIATEALHSAQTQLEFNNGLIAREKTDPNKLVVFNSAGIGISSDGGNTFQTAITGDGIVADVITAGTLRGVVFEQVGTAGIMRADSDGLKIYDLNNNLRAAILLGGLQTIDNSLGLTLIDNNESVFEINQDGQYAKINSKISLVMKSEKDMTLDVSRKSTGAANIRKLLNIRTHIDGSNYRDELVLYRDEQYNDEFSGFNVGNDIMLGNTANIRNARFSIGVGKSSVYSFRRLFIAYLNGTNLVNVPFSIHGDQRRVNISYDIYYKGIPLSTSTEKNKLFMKPLKINPYNILQLNLYDWYDKEIYEQNETLSSSDSKLLKLATPSARRIAGLSAEEVHENGLGTFVYYDDNENISGLMYDKLWTLLIPITKDHENRLNEYDLRFGTIESKIDKLERELEQLKGAI